LNPIIKYTPVSITDIKNTFRARERPSGVAWVVNKVVPAMIVLSFFNGNH
jgi:hypothetical protein